MGASKDVRFGDLALEKGYVTREQLAETLENQKAMAGMGVRQPLGEVMAAKGYITREQLVELLREQQRRTGRHIIIGAYEIVAKLGEGGMGAVYRAKVRHTGAVVALKVLPKRIAADGNFVERFHREAELASRLDHPNIVRAIESGTSGGYHYFAMEFVDGRNVGERLEREGPLPEREALDIVRHVALALQHAGSVGLVHRDVKPENIFLTADAQAKLGDMGLAREAGEEDLRITRDGMMVGTPYYVSPEQARGARDLDTRSDIYSLGASLYHMLTGEVPFEGETALEVINKHLNEDLPWPSYVNPKVSEGASVLVAKMMAKERADRYEEPLEVIGDIDKVLRGGVPETDPLEEDRSSVQRGEKMQLAADAARRRRRERRDSGVDRPAGPARPARRTSTAARVPAASRQNTVLYVAAAAGTAMLLVALLVITQPAGGGRAPKPPRRTGTAGARGVAGRTSPRPKAPKPATSSPAARRALAAARTRREAGDFDGAIAGYRGILWQWPEDKAACETARVAIGEIQAELASRPAVSGSPAAPAASQARKLLYREDFERGAGGWSGRAVREAGRGGVLALKPTPQNQYHPNSGSVYVQRGIKATLATRVRFRYRTEGALRSVRLQLFVTDPNGKGQNCGEMLGASKEWTAADVALSELEVNADGGVDLSKGFSITSLQVYGGNRGEAGRCFIDDFEVYDGAAATPSGPAAADAREIWRERFDKPGRANGWEGDPERKLTFGGSRGAWSAAHVPGNAYHPFRLEFNYNLMRGGTRYLEDAIFVADDDVLVSFYYYLTGTDMIYVYARNVRRAENLHNHIKGAARGRWTPVVLKSMDFALMWAPTERSQKGDKYRTILIAAGRPGDTGMRLVIDDFAITRGGDAAGLLRRMRERLPKAGASAPEPAAKSWRPVFNGRDLDDWRVEGGSARVEGGEMVFPSGVDVRYPGEWRELELECEVKAPTGFGLALGQFQGGRGSSRVRMIYHHDGDLHVWAGSKRLWRSGGGGFGLGDWVKLRLVLTDAKLEIFKDGAAAGAADLSEAPPKTGGVLLYARGGQPARLRSVRVRVLSGR